MDAASALADLTETSAHVEEAAIVDEGGAVLAATAGGERLAAVGVELLREADARLAGTPTQLEVALRECSVFVRRADGRSIVARTGPRPPSALVLHDLEACVRDA